MLKYSFLILGSVLLFTNILYVGVFLDWSDGDLSLFIKHKPTAKQYFYSPKKYYRYQPQELTFAEMKEELAYQEFSKDFKPNRHPWQPAIFSYQLALSFIVLGIMKLFRKVKVKLWHIPIHLIANIFLTVFGVIMILHEGNSTLTAGVLIAIIAINYFTMKLIIRKDGAQEETNSSGANLASLNSNTRS